MADGHDAAARRRPALGGGRRGLDRDRPLHARPRALPARRGELSAALAGARRARSAATPPASTPGLTTRAARCRPSSTCCGYEPEPWRPADSLVWGKLMALQLSANFGDELMRARIAAAIGPERAGELSRPRRRLPTRSQIAAPRRARPARRSPAAADRTGDRLERVGRGRQPHRHRQADARQRSASRPRRADPLVSGAHRDAGPVAGRRHRARRAAPRRSAATTASPGASPPPAPTSRTCSSSSVDPADPGALPDARRQRALRHADRDDPACADGEPDAADGAHDPARPGAVRPRAGGSRKQRPATGRSLALAFTALDARRHHGRRDLRPEPRAGLGRRSRPRWRWISRRSRTSSMPTSTAISASSRRPRADPRRPATAGCRCRAGTGDDRLDRHDPLRRPCRRSTTRRTAASSTPTTRWSDRTIPISWRRRLGGAVTAPSASRRCWRQGRRRPLDADGGDAGRHAVARRPRDPAR